MIINLLLPTGGGIIPTTGAGIGGRRGQTNGMAPRSHAILLENNKLLWTILIVHRALVSAVCRVQTPGMAPRSHALLLENNNVLLTTLTIGRW